MAPVGSTTAEPSRGMGPYRVSDGIVLTPFRLSDADEFFRIMNINGTIAAGLHSDRVTFPFPREEALSFVDRQHRHILKQGQLSRWAIRASVDGPMMGLFAFNPFNHEDTGPCSLPSPTSAEFNCGDVAYWISPEYSGKGVVSKVLAFGLDHLAWNLFAYNRVHGEAWVENTASRRVMERAGMRSLPNTSCFVPKFGMTKEVAEYVVDIDTSKARSG